jgi:hypothetical protein
MADFDAGLVVGGCAEADDGAVGSVDTVGGLDFSAHEVAANATRRGMTQRAEGGTWRRA